MGFHNQVETNPEEALIDDIMSFTRKPYGFVMYSFPWGEEGELEKFQGPDEWQTEVLKEIEKKMLKPYEAIKLAIASGHGPGKSALVAWLVLWAISTCVDTRGVVTANTDSQLRTKTRTHTANKQRSHGSKEKAEDHCGMRQETFYGS